jgi:hypothetical protein
MKTKFALNALFLVLFYFVSADIYSQACSNCTVNITTLDTSVYVVSSGQTLCIDSTGQFEGTITLSGGTICNRGAFHPKSFTISSGTLNNYSHCIIASNFIIGSGFTMANGAKSITTIRGNLTISGGSFTNAGINNVKGNITFSSGTFTNSAIVNCKVLSGAGVANNSGIINQD